MKIARLCAVIAICLFISSQTYAESTKNKNGKGANKSDPAGRVANEAADAVADVLTGEDSQGSSGNMPPGLAKQGKMPPGLAKQGKTPPGWDKGNKVGWNKTTTDSPVKRWIKKWVFGQKDSE